MAEPSSGRAKPAKPTLLRETSQARLFGAHRSGIRDVVFGCPREPVLSRPLTSASPAGPCPRDQCVGTLSSGQRERRSRCRRRGPGQHSIARPTWLEDGDGRREAASAMLTTKIPRRGRGVRRGYPRRYRRMLPTVGELRRTGHKRRISSMFGAQVVAMAPAASGLHHGADVVSSRRSETAPLPRRSAKALQLKPFEPRAWRVHMDTVVPVGRVSLADSVKSCADKRTAEHFHGRSTRRTRSLDPRVKRSMVRKLDRLNAAHELMDLCSPPGNRAGSASRGPCRSPQHSRE